MNSQLRKILFERCKDMGLTDKALDNLATISSVGLDDDCKEEDITKAVDLLVPYAKEMQAEITRKMRATKRTQSAEQSSNEGECEGDNKSEEQMPTWFKPYQEKLQSLENENATLKAEKAKADRASQIASKAQQMGIPDYLIKRVSFAEDADLDKELADYKQELVNNNLVPKEQTHELGGIEEQMKADAKVWAESLPTA